MLKRYLHTTRPSRAVKPVFKPHNPRKGIKTFDDNFATLEKKDERKIWERMDISKHEFFIRKYGNITPEERKRLDEKVARQRRLREERRKHELGDAYVEKSERGPITLNPLSEYLYGTHPVISALTAGKRKGFSNLYIFNPKDETPKILLLAKKYGIKVRQKKSKAEMARLCSNGVHNGVVLETKPLNPPQIWNVDAFSSESGEYDVTCVEDVQRKKHTKRHRLARDTSNTSGGSFPLGIYLDGITDPMNLGNIVRSAYCLGADFIVVPSLDSAKMGPVAAKASAGALDMMTIYKTDETQSLFSRLKKGGWNIVASSAKLKDEPTNAKFIETSDLQILLSEAPAMLVLGSEGSGIKKNLKSICDYHVALEKTRVGDEDNVVDSLNVGCASALLISHFLG